MANPPAHKELEFDEHTEDGYSKAFVDSCTEETPMRRGVLLHGLCPRCHGPMDFPVVSQANRGTRSKGKARTATVPLLCTCTRDHQGRPGGEHGCGAYWNIELS
ncbi:hypothetical protein [Actinomycetospora straminea]|uniref:Recombination endonuclease VII n=1 Tax=Actinomycetospora straminea TaxID=663607 RepID=A0ABP9EM96_9PSEU|nr:hypothetical protein [Actinomycetospora straminea]MDD7933758.1 hypothetical protein [Actinomycetospora straminea]